MDVSWRRRGWLTAGFLALCLFAASMAASSFLGSATAADPKVEAELLEQVSGGEEAVFWVYLAEQADLSAAAGIADRSAQGRFVYQQLTQTAERSQAGLLAFLEAEGAAHESFWIANTVKVTGDEELLDEIAARPEVERITADRVYELPEPIPAEEENRIQAVEWGIDRINAPGVWAQFGTRGEGIVVGSIDTGALYTHAALVEQYRGNQGDGTFDHNYNWHDPSNVCGNPSLAPCDNNGHGTHVTGTMVGDDGDPGPNQIGVAPAARWISAKGCETTSCSTAALLSSGQFILAPTDLNNLNPDPDKRPHIVNNSWGGGATTDPWYRPTVEAWVAAGIFPQFANGNNIPGCTASSNPGNLSESYAAGAFDINNNIAGFSNRGPSAWDANLIKPNISAPGVAVRSSWNNGAYNTISGTSMASPHVAGAVALLWSAAPALERHIDATRSLLDQTAIDMSDLQCGGTPENNNVWGEGRLDVLAAANEAPIGPTGSLEGTVTDAGTTMPIAGATVQAVGEITRTATTDANGSYSFPVLSVGTYDVTASRFGYLSQTESATIEEDQTTTLDFALEQAPSHSVSGHVRDADDQALEGATVTINATPIPPATTDANGFYSFPSVPEGTYTATATASRCHDVHTQDLVVSGPTTLDFTLPQRSDAFGYSCRLEEAPFEEAETVLPITGDDVAVTIDLPFPSTFYGQTHTRAHICTNGFVEFVGPTTTVCTFGNVAVPSTARPNGAVYPYWDDLFVDDEASIRADARGSAPNRRFVIEFRNLRYFGDTTRRVDFNVVLHENGEILTQYRNIADDGRERGNSATLGIENHAGTIALQYSFNEAVLDVEPAVTSIRYFPPPPAYAQAVNAGGRAYTDTEGEPWAADRAYTEAGGFGYMPASAPPVSTRKQIAGTDDPTLYQTARRALQEYRFDAPNGVYQVWIRFAEIQNAKAGQRRFDVVAEGTPVLFDFDIAASAGGQNRAYDAVFFVNVEDGQLNLRFVTRLGFRDPLVNAIRVVHRSGS